MPSLASLVLAQKLHISKKRYGFNNFGMTYKGVRTVRIFLDKLTLVLVAIVLTVVINMGCSIQMLAQNPENTAEEPQESVLAIVDTADVENPAFVGSVQLPFRVNSNSGIVLSGNYAYVTTKRHLHVVNLSNWQHPSLTASMPFPDTVGDAKLFGHRLFVAGPQEIYVVDVSNPNNPSLQSTTRTDAPLGSIKAFDVHNGYLYVMDAGYYLHIFNVAMAEPQFVEAVAVSRSQLASVRAKGEFVQLIQTQSSYFSPGIWREFSDRQDLLEISARYEKLRISDDYLLFATRGHPTGVITIARENDRTWAGGQFEHYNMEAYHSDYLRTRENEAPDTQELADLGARSGGIVVNNLDRWNQSIVPEENILGPVTDFQISGDLLYVSSLNGYLSIINIYKTGRPFQRNEDRFLSATSLNGFHPVRMAVGENYVCMLGDLGNSE